MLPKTSKLNQPNTLKATNYIKTMNYQMVKSSLSETRGKNYLYIFRIRCPELLFDPKLEGKEFGGIHELTF